MSKRITITADGKKLNAKDGEYLIEVLRRHGIDVPSLCYHPGVEPYASCRLCVVEVTAGKRTRLVTSCTYQVTREIEVATDTERVRRTRQTVARLLLARCPENELIQALAARFGVDRETIAALTPFNEDCVLCGLCVRVCQGALGSAAIGFAQRGREKKVAMPFMEPSARCTGCGACAAVCPTGLIKVAEREGKRLLEVWGVERELAVCASCGKALGTTPQLERAAADEVLALIRKEIGKLCPACRAERAAGELTHVKGGLHERGE